LLLLLLLLYDLGGGLGEPKPGEDLERFNMRGLISDAKGLGGGGKSDE
jgi:hypothetical protein